MSPYTFLNSSIAFHKRNLWTFNLTIRDCTNDQTYCFIWDKSVSGRGTNEIASCFWRFFYLNINFKRHLVIYSDICAGQNKNNIISAMLLLFCNQTTIDIEQKFLKLGHIHLEWMTIALSKRKKTKQIRNIPSTWLDSINKELWKKVQEIHYNRNEARTFFRFLGEKLDLDFRFHSKTFSKKPLKIAMAIKIVQQADVI